MARPVWHKAFLAALAKTGNVSESAKKARITRDAAYKSRDKNESFRQQWDEAKEVAADAMEAEALRRAVRGVSEPVYQGGKKVGAIRKYSDTLLIFLLKAARPEKFRDRQDVRHSGAIAHEGPVIVEMPDNGSDSDNND